MRAIKRFWYWWGFWRLEGYDGKPTSAKRAWELARVWSSANE